MTPQESFSIGDWIVVPSRNRIQGRVDRASRTIEPLLMRLLCALASRRGDTVGKDDLIREVWNGLFVSDEALSQAISRLRRALADDPQKPRYIETVRSRGYRLKAPVTVVPSRRPGWLTKRRLLLLGAVTAAAGLAAVFWVRGGGSGEVVPVARDLRDERNVAVAPDGRQVAYEVVEANGITTIWVSDLDRPEPMRMSGADGGMSPAWLSNRTLAMQTGLGADCRIVSVRFGEPGVRELGRCPGSAYADLAASQDGRRLAYNGPGPDPSGPRVIHLLDVGGQARRMTRPPAGAWGDYDPAFSPDGRSLLFVRAISEGQQDLYLITPDGGERRLTRRFGNIHGATWLGPTRIVYAARSGGRYSLRILDTASRQDRPFPIPITDAVNPVFREGALMVEARRFESRLVRTSADATRPALPNASGINLHPALSPDGRSLVFMSDRSGAYELWMQDQGSGQMRQLTRHNGGFVGTPRFTPNGRFIVYEVRTGDDSDIRLLDLSTNRSRVLVGGRHFDTAPSVSADGQRVYFGSDRGEGWNVYAVPLSGRRPPVLTIEGAFTAIEAPDGDALYFTRRPQAGLFRLDKHFGRTSVVSAPFAPQDWGAYQPVRGGVVAIDRANGRLVLFDTMGRRRTLANPVGRIPSHDPVLAATPDLGQIVHAETGPGSGDLYRVVRW